MENKLMNQEDKLFKEWSNFFKLKNEKISLIPDGITSESSGSFTKNKKEHKFKGWNDSPVKILFILKEVNDPKNEKDWDLRKYLFAGARKNTWGNIARWTYAINKYAEEKKALLWDEVAKRNNDVGRLKHLKSICAMNIKKTPGKSRANDIEIKNFAVTNKSFLSQQLKIYSDADVVICCGRAVGEAYRSVLDNIQWENYCLENKGGTSVYRKEAGPLLISFYHPQMRTKTHEALYRELMYYIERYL